MTVRTATARPPALPVLWAGLATTVLTAAVTVLDQAAFGSIHARVTAVYADHPGVGDGSESFVVTLLLGIAVLGAVGWLVTVPGARRRARWAPPVGTTLWVLGAGAAVTAATATEYGTTLVPPWLGVLGLLPPLVGLVAVVRLWRDRR